MSQETPGYLVWMDLEMTGLDPESDEIIEVASVITTDELDIVASGPNLVIRQDAARFDQMDEWNQEHHTSSGLWKKVLSSNLSIAEAEARTLAFVKEYIKSERSAPLCGNSIWQDRRFIRKYMPTLDGYLHYRMIDVSAIKELGFRWFKGIEYEEKNLKHRAYDDILESIDELRFYRQNFFKASG